MQHGSQAVLSPYAVRLPMLKSEAGCLLPVVYYKVFAYAYHPSIAFAVNCIILVSNAASLAAVALVGGEYITGIFVPQSNDSNWILNPANAQHIQNVQIIIAITAIIIFYGVNLLGLKMSARAQNVLTVIKITMIILLLTPLFFAAGPVHPVIASATPASPLFTEYLKAFGVGLGCGKLYLWRLSTNNQPGRRSKRSSKNNPAFHIPGYHYHYCFIPSYQLCLCKSDWV